MEIYEFMEHTSLCHYVRSEYKDEMFQSQTSSLLWEQCGHVPFLETSYVNLGRASPDGIRKDLVGS